MESVTSAGEICTHAYPVEGRCKRKKHSSYYCEFHTPHGSDKRISDKSFLRRMHRLIKKGDTDWRGFIFPKLIELEQYEIPVYVNAVGASFGDVFIKQGVFNHQVDVSKSTFGGDVNTSSTRFLETLCIQESIFEGKCNWTHIEVESGVQAHTCHFKQDFLISGTLNVRVNFNQSIFEQRARFLQTKNVTLSINPITVNSRVTAHSARITLHSGNETKLQLIWERVVDTYLDVKAKVIAKLTVIRDRLVAVLKSNKDKARSSLNQLRLRFPHHREGVIRHVLFSGEAHLQNIVFHQPSLVLFQGVDLRGASFGGTDLREISFVGNNWYQKELKRNGLIEETRYKKINNYYDKKEALPALENTYRNIRYAMEDSKDFARANDFFVGEMEAKRKQLPFYKRYLLSIDAIYKVISEYGTNPVRCLLFFVFFAVLHSILISAQINTGIDGSWVGLEHSLLELQGAINIDGFARMLESANKVLLGYVNFDSLVYSLQTMTLQRDKIALIPKGGSSTVVGFINFAWAILGPVLAGLFVLTVRTRIKRH